MQEGYEKYPGLFPKCYTAIEEICNARINVHCRTATTVIRSVNPIMGLPNLMAANPPDNIIIATVANEYVPNPGKMSAVFSQIPNKSVENMDSRARTATRILCIWPGNVLGDPMHPAETPLL